VEQRCLSNLFRGEDLCAHEYRSLSELESLGIINPHRIDLKLPHDVRDSYSWELINIRHILVVTVETVGGCTTTSPESAYQIRVVRSDNEADAPVRYAPSHPTEMVSVMAEVLPPEWNPTVTPDIVVVPKALVVLVDEEELNTPSGEGPVACLPRQLHLLQLLNPPSIQTTTTTTRHPNVQELQNLVESNLVKLVALLNDGAPNPSSP
jgi:hypothetical protein